MLVHSLLNITKSRLFERKTVRVQNVNCMHRMHMTNVIHFVLGIQYFKFFFI